MKYGSFKFSYDAEPGHAAPFDAKVTDSGLFEVRTAAPPTAPRLRLERQVPAMYPRDEVVFLIHAAAALQEEDRGRLVDVPGYGKRIERNFSGSAACHRRQFGLAQLSRGDGNGFAIGGRFDEIGHCLPPVVRRPGASSRLCGGD
jgi:hypothetical protein